MFKKPPAIEFFFSKVAGRQKRTEKDLIFFFLSCNFISDYDYSEKKSKALAKKSRIIFYKSFRNSVIQATSCAYYFVVQFYPKFQY